MYKCTISTVYIIYSFTYVCSFCIYAAMQTQCLRLAFNFYINYFLLASMPHDHMTHSGLHVCCVQAPEALTAVSIATWVPSCAPCSLLSTTLTLSTRTGSIRKHHWETSPRDRVRQHTVFHFSVSTYFYANVIVSSRSDEFHAGFRVFFFFLNRNPFHTTGSDR